MLSSNVPARVDVARSLRKTGTIVVCKDVRISFVLVDLRDRIRCVDFICYRL